MQDVHDYWTEYKEAWNDENQKNATGKRDKLKKRKKALRHI